MFCNILLKHIAIKIFGRIFSDILFAFFLRILYLIIYPIRRDNIHVCTNNCNYYCNFQSAIRYSFAACFLFFNRLFYHSICRITCNDTNKICQSKIKGKYARIFKDNIKHSSHPPLKTLMLSMQNARWLHTTGHLLILYYFIFNFPLFKASAKTYESCCKPLSDGSSSTNTRYAHDPRRSRRRRCPE